jgi:hypothetical protein
MFMNPTIHVWSRCHCCGMNPITGPCFRCETCPLGPDIDLCSDCYAGYLEGSVVHPSPDAVVAIDRATHHFTRYEGSLPETFTDWLNVAAFNEPPLGISSGFLVRPEFRSGRESAFAGYGFITRFGPYTLLLTALHVMDELIKNKRIDTTKRNQNYTGEELPRHVTSVRLYDVLQDRWMLHELGDAGPMLVLSNARTADDEPFAFRDIAAFRVKPQQGLSPLPLASEDPQPGDAVWLAAAMPDRSRTRRAVCVENSSRGFIFRYEESKEMPKHSSGAPILDFNGEVVGINTGLGRIGRYEIGHANPLGSIRAHLTEALWGPLDIAAVPSVRHSFLY